MRLIHTTTLRNLASVREHGLLCSYSRQARKAVWLHPCHKCLWAEKHVRDRHDAHEEELVHLWVEVPKSWVSWHSSNCAYCFQDIPWERVKRIQVVRRVVEELPV